MLNDFSKLKQLAGTELGIESWFFRLQSICTFYILFFTIWLFNTEIEVGIITYTVCTVLICERINTILINIYSNYLVAFTTVDVRACFFSVWDVSVMLCRRPTAPNCLLMTVLNTSVKFVMASELKMIKMEWS